MNWGWPHHLRLPAGQPPALEVTATLPVGYTFNDFNFTYDKVGNLLTLQNTARRPAASPRAASVTTASRL